MDISFQIETDKFNYRVGGMILSNGKILAMHDQRSPYYYLPGGRVKLGETAEAAVLRELREELNITARIQRPLWLHQSFFTEDVDHLRYHELCLYFLIDVSATDLLERGPAFSSSEAGHVHTFEWLPFEALRQEYFYPLFLKEAIFDLPETLTLLTTYE